MSDPFVGDWNVVFTPLQGVDKKDPYPFGEMAVLSVVKKSGTAIEFVITPKVGTPVLFLGTAADGTPPSIMASGSTDKPSAAQFTFIGYFVATIDNVGPLLTGTYVRRRIGPPGEDPPDTGGWVGGNTAPEPHR